MYIKTLIYSSVTLGYSVVVNQKNPNSFLKLEVATDAITIVDGLRPIIQVNKMIIYD